MDSTDSDFKIKTHVFEGPLDVLLSLIEKRKLFINDISLSQVANDFIAYVEYIQNEENGDQKKVVDNLAQFILVASTLVLIKSKSLLPQLSLSEEEKGKQDTQENFSIVIDLATARADGKEAEAYELMKALEEKPESMFTRFGNITLRDGIALVGRGINVP
jgi:chromatin segregation and condensation protein Rec8/ScpA/Scc1 (kleisin family)